MKNPNDKNGILLNPVEQLVLAVSPAPQTKAGIFGNLPCLWLFTEKIKCSNKAKIIGVARQLAVNCRAIGQQVKQIGVSIDAELKPPHGLCEWPRGFDRDCAC